MANDVRKPNGFERGMNTGGVRIGGGEFISQNDLDAFGKDVGFQSFRATTGARDVGSYQKAVAAEDARKSQPLVPAAYQNLSVEGIMLQEAVVLRVLEKLDSDRTERYAEKWYDPKLIAWLALPVAQESGVFSKRAAVELADIEAVRALDARFADALAAMQASEKAPSTSDYLAKIYDASQIPVAAPVSSEIANAADEAARVAHLTATATGSPVQGGSIAAVPPVTTWSHAHRWIRGA